MKIAIDARMVTQKSMHGIARYVYQLLECLASIASTHEFYILVNRSSTLWEKSWPRHIHPVLVKARWISFREQWELPLLLRRLKVDLFHAPSFVAPMFCPCRLVMTIHDLNHIVLPQFYTPIHQFYYQTFVRKCIGKSEVILTVSHFSKDEIVRTLGISPQKIVVTYNGVSSHYIPVTDEDQLEFVREVYGLPREFIFCLANNKPHKNLHQLVRAFVFSKINIPLVIACTPDLSLIRLAESFQKKHLLFFSTFIEEEHLPTVYSLSSLFVYPSTYEGFGLPPLEAMSCGVPVVVARSSSLPEVVGNNARFIDPHDYQNIASTLEEALLDKDESRRERVTDGRSHAKTFSWMTMSKQTLHVYETCSNPS